MHSRLASVRQKGLKVAAATKNLTGRTNLLRQYQNAFIDLLNRNNTHNSIPEAGELLKKMAKEDKIRFNFETTSILNKVFQEDKTGQYSDLYIAVMKKNGLDPGYFQIARFVRQGEYEQACDLFWNRYRHYTKEWAKRPIEPYKLVKSLRAYWLLEEASKRGDTDQIGKLMDVIEPCKGLTTPNYSKLLEGAMKFRDAKVCKRILRSSPEDMELTDGWLKRLVPVLAEAGDVELALQLLDQVRSKELRKKLCLAVVSLIHPTKTFWQIIEGCNIKYDDLPAQVLSLPYLSDYEEITIWLNDLKTLDANTQSLLLYALLTSIDNRSHVGSTLFVLRYLLDHKRIHLLGSSHVDAICHTASKFGAKMASIVLIQLFKEQAIPLSLQNYYHLMRCECAGTEHDNVYLVVIECLKEHGELNENATKLMETLKQTGDTRGAQIDDLDAFKASVDYGYLLKNFKNEHDRIRMKHQVLNGMGEYSLDNDVQDLRLLGQTF